MITALQPTRVHRRDAHVNNNKKNTHNGHTARRTAKRTALTRDDDGPMVNGPVTHTDADTVIDRKKNIYRETHTEQERITQASATQTDEDT